ENPHLQVAIFKMDSTSISGILFMNYIRTIKLDGRLGFRQLHSEREILFLLCYLTWEGQIGGVKGKHLSVGGRLVLINLWDILISVYLEGLWQEVIRKKDMFLERGVFSVNNGRDIRFWEDRCPLNVSFRRGLVGVNLQNWYNLSIQHLFFDCHYAKNDLVLFRGIYWC
ncbi:hypothetical protein ACJX0J_031062, partial [Zea mays]